MNVTLSRLQDELHEAIDQVASLTRLPSVDRKWILERAKNHITRHLISIKAEEQAIADKACL